MLWQMDISCKIICTWELNSLSIWKMAFQYGMINGKKSYCKRQTMTWRLYLRPILLLPLPGPNPFLWLFSSSKYLRTAEFFKFAGLPTLGLWKLMLKEKPFINWAVTLKLLITGRNIIKICKKLGFIILL